jgi:hypothetical protein
MDGPVEEAARRGVGEDDRAESRPVDRPVGPEDGPPEAGHDLAPGRTAGAHELVGGLVGGIDDRAFIGQEPGDDGFAAGDPPGQGDAEGAISSWRLS